MQIFLKSSKTKRSLKSPNDLKRPRMTSKDANENEKPVFKKVKTKNNLRGGDANDVNPNQGSVFIEKPFASPING